MPGWTYASKSTMSMFQRVRVCTGSHSTNQQYPCFRVLLSAQAASVNPSTTKPCLCFRVLVYAWSLSVNQSTMCIFQSARVGTGSFIQPVNHVHVSECSCIHGQCHQLLSQPVNPVHVSECSCLQRQRQSTHQPVNHVYVSECSCMQGQCQSPRQSTSQLCACFRVLVSTRAVSVNPTVNQSTMQCFRVLVSTRAVSGRTER